MLCTIPESDFKREEAFLPSLLSFLLRMMLSGIMTNKPIILKPTMIMNDVPISRKGF